GADVSLAAGLIKTANSPFFGTRGRVRSVNEALVMLGLDVASRAIAGIILRKVFPASLHLERFWDASARIARLSGWLAKQVGRNKLRQDDAYTFGLFRDCGIPVLLMRFPGYGRVLAAANAEERQGFTAIEDAQLPTNHAMVGCLLAQSWWLPEETCLAIRHHHDVAVIETPSITPPLTSRYRIAMAQLAEHLVQRHSGLSHTNEWPKLGAACLRLLEIDESQVDAIFTESVPILDAEE
ncbi:MAG: HDOD domain-containing protein, partial [Rhodocyclales bacterium]|nr:HDOD domain-containing protein [Rhodocyclales bacterium]